MPVGQSRKNITNEEWKITDAVAASGATKNPYGFMSTRQFNMYAKLGKYYNANDRALGLDMEYYKRLLVCSPVIARATLRLAIANSWSVDQLIKNFSAIVPCPWITSDKYRCVTPDRTSYAHISVNAAHEKYFRVGDRLFTKTFLANEIIPNL